MWQGKSPQVKKFIKIYKKDEGQSLLPWPKAWIVLIWKIRF